MTLKEKMDSWKMEIENKSHKVFLHEVKEIDIRIKDALVFNKPTVIHNYPSVLDRQIREYIESGGLEYHVEKNAYMAHHYKIVIYMPGHKKDPTIGMSLWQQILYYGLRQDSQ